MSVEIRSKGGRLIGKLSDDMDGEDFLVVGDKKVPIAEVYGNKELRDSFNEGIKKINEEENSENDTECDQ